MTEISNEMRRVLRARQEIVKRQPYMASLAFTAKIVEMADSSFFRGMETMCTDGNRIYFSPQFVRDHDAHIEGVLAHEIWHCALLHVPRLKGREPAKWNIATDLKVNPLVLQAWSLPDGCLLDPSYDDDTAEKVYDKLKDGQKIGLNNGKQATLRETSGRMIDGPVSEEEAKQWKRAFGTMASEAERSGCLHGALKRIVDEIIPPHKVDWRDAVRNMIRDYKSRESSSWSHPNRRFIHSGMHLPGFTKDMIYRLVVCLDTSGSITKDMLNEMVAEVSTLLDENLINRAVMISTDTSICSMDEVSEADGVKKFDLGHCGGGTNFDAAMKEVRKIHDAVGVVFLTDMETSSFGENPGIPVAWINWSKSGNRTAPFGYVYDYNH